MQIVTKSRWRPRAGVVVFAVSLVLYVAFSFWILRLSCGDPQQRSFLLTGDEPHYLLVTHSLVADGDANLHNNVDGKDWRHYTVEEIRPTHSWGFDIYNELSDGRLQEHEEAWQTRRYSKHRNGLPLLLTPAYALGLSCGGRIRFFAILFMNLAAALLAYNIFAAAREETGNREAALCCWFAMGFAPPLLYYSNQIYPDLVAGLLILYAYRLIGRSGGVLRSLAVGSCIGYLPWLHERYLLVAAPLLLYWLWRDRSRGRWLALALTVVIVSAGLQMMYYYRLFGVPFPVNVHRSFSLIGGLKQGFLGLLIDGNQGLAWYAPVYLAAGVGLVGLWRERRGEALALLGLAIPFWVAICMYKHWYSIWYPPLRYLVALLPLAAGPMARAWQVGRRGYGRLVYAVLGGVGVFVGFYGIRHPRLYYTKLHVLRSLSPKLEAIWRHLPDFLPPTTQTFLRAGGWLSVALALFAYLMFMAYGRGRGEPHEAGLA